MCSSKPLSAELSPSRLHVMFEDFGINETAHFMSLDKLLLALVKSDDHKNALFKLQHYILFNMAKQFFCVTLSLYHFY